MGIPRLPGIGRAQAARRGTIPQGLRDGTICNNPAARVNDPAE
jgi:hypothetical protein